MLTKKKIRASAIEMLNFVETFTLIISGLIDDESKKEWLLYKTLRDIMSILMSDTINEEEILYLTCLITEHHELYLDCFDDFLKAKHHLMIHYPLVIRIIGPILQVWTLRFESFHQLMKQTAKMSRNRINLLKTFSLKNELLNANLLLNSDFKLVNQINGKIKLVYHDNIRTTYSCPTEFLVDSSMKIHHVQMNNLKYHNGVCVQIDNLEIPTFCLIKEIFVCQERVYFGVEILINNGFNKTYFGYSIHRSKILRIISFDSVVESHIIYFIHKCVDHNILVRIRT